MKKSILLFSLVLLCQFVNAQLVILKGPNNNVLGYVEEGEKFKDLTSSQILDFSTDGQVKSLSGDLAATYNRTTGEVLDLNGDLLFKIDGDNIKNSSNVIIASVDSGGNLKDADNYVLGNAVGIDKYFIAFYFLVYNKV